MVDAVVDFLEFLGQRMLEFGMAGAILLVFYLLMSNELKHLRESIEKLTTAVNENSKVLAEIRAILDVVEKRGRT